VRWHVHPSRLWGAISFGVLSALATAIFFAGTPQGTPRAKAAAVSILAAGDIASGANQNDEATAKVLRAHAGMPILTLGDNAYEGGTSGEYSNYYAPTWGTEKTRTHPTPGNHDYGTSGASGYFNYFGAAAHKDNAGSYSWDYGSWHIIALNTGQCFGTPESDGSMPRCGPGDPMLTWLQHDLAAHAHSRCTLGYWHHPRFSSGKEHGNDFSRTTAIWNALYKYHADVVLNGHDHNYERFAPKRPNGTLAKRRGIREFVVGTGGRSLRPFGTIQPNSEVRNSDTYGVLQLSLNSRSYDWKFLPIGSKSFTDSGTQSCH
jgi:acid phosphatase type 7